MCDGLSWVIKLAYTTLMRYQLSELYSSIDHSRGLPCSLLIWSCLIPEVAGKAHWTCQNTPYLKYNIIIKVLWVNSICTDKSIKDRAHIVNAPWTQRYGLKIQFYTAWCFLHRVLSLLRVFCGLLPGFVHNAGQFLNIVLIFLIGNGFFENERFLGP